MINKLPEHNIEAEESLLASLVIDSSLLKKCGNLSPADFYDKKHQTIFQAIRLLEAKKETVDLVTLTTALKKAGMLSSAGGAAYILRLTDTAALFNVSEYIKIIKDCSLTRETKFKCMSIIDSDLSGPELLEKAQTDILSIQASNRGDDIRNIRDIVIKHIERIENANSREDEGNVYQLGFPNIDRCLRVRDGKLIVIAGRPKMGKTALAVTIAKNLDMSGVKVGFLSIEMSESEMMDRFVSMTSRVDSSKLGRFKALTPTEIQNLNDAGEILFDSNIMIDDTGSLDITDVERKCRLLKTKGAQVIIIDQLSQIGNKNIKAGEHTILFSENCNRLARLKKELNLPIILLHQLNRDVKNRANKEPVVSDLKQTGRIEEDADAVIFVHRPEEYAENEMERSTLSGKAFLTLALNRSGPTFRDTNILFDKPTTYFYQGFKNGTH
jgi:replicative DNA helicase